MAEADQHQEFTDLYAAHEQGLYGFVYSLVHSRNDADDVIQETMTQLWEHFGEYDRSRPFFPWASRFAYRQVLMLRRHSSSRRLYLSEEMLSTLAQEYPETADWEESRRRALRLCLTKLTERQSELLRQRYESGQSLVEIADQLSRPVNALYKSLQRIRANLVHCVERELATGERV